MRENFGSNRWGLTRLKRTCGCGRKFNCGPAAPAWPSRLNLRRLDLAELSEQTTGRFSGRPTKYPPPSVRRGVSAAQVTDFLKLTTAPILFFKTSGARERAARARSRPRPGGLRYFPVMPGLRV